MRFTSRVSPPRLTARRLDRGHRQACTRASRGFGKMWSAAAARSGSIFTRFCGILFQDQFRQIEFETFYRAINKVQRSLIRTDADEVTYNLHIMMRFDLELELLEGHLRVKDLPEAWRARMQADLGLAPADDRDGCLQDVHWYGGTVGGGFQSYTIGNILSAQFYAAALKTVPTSRPRSQQGNSERFTAGCANTSTSMGASSSQVRSSCGRPAGR